MVMNQRIFPVLPLRVLTIWDPHVHLCLHPDEGATTPLVAITGLGLRFLRCVPARVWITLCCSHLVSSMSLANGGTMVLPTSVCPLRVDQHVRLCPMSTGSPHRDPTAQQFVRLFLLLLSLVSLAVLPPRTLTNLDPHVHLFRHPVEGATKVLCCPHMVSPLSLA